MMEKDEKHKKHKHHKHHKHRHHSSRNDDQKECEVSEHEVAMLEYHERIPERDVTRLSDKTAKESSSGGRTIHRTRSRSGSRSRDRRRTTSGYRHRSRSRDGSGTMQNDDERKRVEYSSRTASHEKAQCWSHDRSRRRSHDRSRRRSCDRSRSRSCDSEKVRNIEGQKTLDSTNKPNVREKPCITQAEYKDSGSGSSDDGGDDERSPDYKFDWESHRYTLDRMFFRHSDYIKRNTQECDDFWSFLRKYTDFQKRKAAQQQDTGMQKPRVKPVDKHQRLNKDWKAMYRQLVPQERIGKDGKSIYTELTLHRARQFRDLILYYWDFIDKQKKAKEDKIRNDQKNLPIYQYKEHIIDTVRKNQVVLVAGDTGCGKSTQVPQYLLEAGFTNVACTQPRRIACISLAKRVSYETLNEYGSEVAHQIRFEKTRTKSTRLLFLTEGLLLRQICNDSLLEQYNVLVIDEVHERHIHTDFLLGVLKCLLLQREDLKLILMSATINIDLFSNYFDQCPVVKVPGRLYPIELQYLPLTVDEQSSKTERLDPAPYIRVLQLIDHKYPVSERGDVLMFLSGMSEIMSVAEAAKAYSQKTKRWIILLLHSTLSVAEQDKVFDIAPDGVRKCIISTNIAETSVTIDGVRFVVDSGKVKEMSYDTQFKMQKLQEFWISRASAEQRKGRAGRTGPGKCFRLYSEADYDALQDYSTPEIHRVPLDNLILQMIAMGLPDARKFPYLETPDDSVIENSLAFLKEQEALTPDETLTPTGQMLAQLPVDIVIGKMLIMASVFQIVDPVLSIAASLSVQSPFTMKAHRDVDAMSQRKELESDHGDPITLLNAFDQWVLIKAEGRDTRKWCHRRGLEEQRFFEMMKLKRQFQDILHDYGLVDEGESVDPEHLTREERRQRNINRKRLHELRHEQRMKSNKRKLLKLEDEDWQLNHPDAGDLDLPEDIDTDIKDLEFKLSNDLGKMQEKHNQSRSLTMREITLLKVILCSGLFPQVAIADEHNSFKSQSEQAFHTKNKGFVLIHPTSVFYQKPEVLELKEHEIKDGGVKRSHNKGHLSNKHQLLAYVSILETLKPYLMGCLRVPALQTLLLFSSGLDTNATCTRILCDGWLEITMEDPDQAEAILSAAVKLRRTWQQLLELKLEVSNSNKDSLELDQSLLRRTRKVQAILSQKLTEFLHHDVYYYIRRVLAAELNYIYIGPTPEPAGGSSVGAVISSLMSAGGKPHPTKGGTEVNNYLVYNCLCDDEDADAVSGGYTSCLQRHWHCDQCGENLVVTLAERLQHQQHCVDKQVKNDNLKETDKEKDASLKALRKSYHCPTCSKNFSYTTAEIFTHKKNCK